MLRFGAKSCTFFSKKLLAQIEKSLYLQVPKELGAHTLCVDSTHQYFDF